MPKASKKRSPVFPMPEPDMPCHSSIKISSETLQDFAHVRAHFTRKVLERKRLDLLGSKGSVTSDQVLRVFIKEFCCKYGIYPTIPEKVEAV